MEHIKRARKSMKYLYTLWHFQTKVTFLGGLMKVYRAKLKNTEYGFRFQTKATFYME